MTAYYNENDPYAAEWLRNLIAAGHIAPGVVKADNWGDYDKITITVTDLEPQA